MELTIRYLARVERREGRRIHRTWGQLAKGLGFDTGGLSDRRVRDLYRSRIYNWLDYLAAAGFVSSREALYEANGEGRCVLIVLAAGAAQAVRGAAPGAPSTPPARRSSRRRECVFSPGEVGTPPGGVKGGMDSSRPLSPEQHQQQPRASAPDRHAGPPPRASVLAALEAINGGSPGEGEASGYGALTGPWAAELTAPPIATLARAAWQVLGDRPDGRLSRLWADRLAVAAGQLERTGYAGLTGPAAPAAAIIDLAAGDWADHWHQRRPGDRPPQTVGGLAACFRKLARRHVAGWRQRRDPARHDRAAAWRRDRSRKTASLR